MRGLLLFVLLASVAEGQSGHHPFDSRFLNLPTPETAGFSTLEVLFTHRFTQTVDDRGEDLFGLDSPAEVGIGLALGLGFSAQVELYRSSFRKELEIAGKLVLFPFQQGRPWAVALRAGADYRGGFRLSPRWSGFSQAVLAYRPSPNWLVALVPTFVTDTPTLRRAGNVGLAWAWELPRRMRLQGEFVPPNPQASQAKWAWALGWTKGVPGHSFTVYLGNSRATTTDLWVGSDFPGGYRLEDIRLGFNLVRRFPE